MTNNEKFNAVLNGCENLRAVYNALLAFVEAGKGGSATPRTPASAGVCHLRVERSAVMRIRLEHNGTVFEFERKPMPEGRFRALCAIVAAGLYAGMVAAVTALCGIWAVVVIMVVTVLMFGITNI